ncbi:MAG: 2-oxo acid dehydrogenase subunit E2, partial [Oxalobacteraceae bacterium]
MPKQVRPIGIPTCPAFTPIANAPAMAIGGLTKLQERPVHSDRGDGIAWRSFMSVSLSYDHRVING